MSLDAMTMLPPRDRECIVLVDAFSTGAMLAHAFAREHRCVHVQSRIAMPDAFRASLPRDLFAAAFLVGPEGPSAIVAELVAWRPRAVVAASEFGIEVADFLAAALHLIGNDVARSPARRDKWLMGEVVGAAHLPVASQAKSASLAELLAWYRRRNGRPVVVKPIDSAGSDNVHICTGEAEIETAFQQIAGATNLMMRLNRDVLIQEHLQGDEYVVNSVSHSGRHWICDIWKSEKRYAADGRKIYDLEDLVAPDTPEAQSIVRYIKGVLDALGIAYGAAHSELILTDEGPRLLETGARVSGLANPAALDRCTGTNQIALTKACYTDVAALDRQPALYRRLSACRCVSLIAHRVKPFPMTALHDRLRTLATFESARFRLADGVAMRPTVDLNSSPGAVFLLDPDQERIEHDYEALRAWEAELL